MSKLEEHPVVQRVRAAAPSPRVDSIDGAELRELCLKFGADDVGFVSLDRGELDDQRAEILAAFPFAKTLISLVVRMNREPIRSPARSVANLEFHSSGEHLNDVSRKLVTHLEDMGARAANPAMGFPMEMDRFPGKIWIISHKPVAVAAGLGQMGIHRNVIHPKFGNFILLGTIVVGATVTEESKPIEYNPCVDCKLCVAACPVGAIAADGGFNFASCFTHNYREFMGGFSDWAEGIAESRTAKEYRQKTNDSESASMWQSLSFGANYKAAYCLSVCPAGEDVMSPFLDDRKQFLEDTLKPLQAKEETLYVIPGSDAEEYAKKRYPHKPTKHVKNVLRPATIDGFISNMQHSFQSGQSGGLDATYHFAFFGNEPAQCTVKIADRKIEIRNGHEGKCDLLINADSTSWLNFLRAEVSIVWLLLTRRVRLKGDPRLLLKFGKCFP